MWHSSGIRPVLGVLASGVSFALSIFSCAGGISTLQDGLQPNTRPGAVDADLDVPTFALWHVVLLLYFRFLNGWCERNADKYKTSEGHGSSPAPLQAFDAFTRTAMALSVAGGWECPRPSCSNMGSKDCILTGVVGRLQA